MRNHLYIFIIFFSNLLLISSCVSYKNLEQDRSLLVDQKIEGSKAIDKSTLYSYIRLKPNRSLFKSDIRLPLYFYMRGEKYYKRNYQKDSIKYADMTEYFEEVIKAMEDEWKEDVIDNRTYLDSLYQQDVYLVYKELKKVERQTVRDSVRGIKKLRKVKSKSISKTEKIAERVEKGNWWMRSAGEPPAYFDLEESQNTQKLLERTLHAKGYLNASVDLDVDTVIYRDYRLITEKYIINEESQWKVNSVKYKTPSYSIYNELLTYSKKSYLQENGPYSENSLQLERSRLTKVLKNSGYFDFASNYIHYEVDTNNVQGKVDILILVDAPKSGERHTRYHINDITFETDPTDPVLSDTVEYEDVTYIQHAKKYKPKILDGKLALKESTPYNELLSNDTRRFLSQMDAFKFVNIEYVKTGKDSLNVFIYPSSFDKYQYAFETGLNVSRSLPGPFASVSLKSRNVFRGAESIEFRGRFSLEAQASVSESSNEIYNGTEYGFSTILNIPRPLIPFYNRFNESYYIRNAKTKVLADVSYVSRPEYTRLNLKGLFGYDWRNRKEDLFELSLADLNVVRTPFLSNDFRVRLQQLAEQGNTLHYSFDNSFVSSTHLSMSRMRGDYMTSSSKASYMKLFGEVGGNILDLVNQWSGSEPGAIYGLRYYKFFKFYFDYRKVTPIGSKKKHFFASRLHMGVAKSYGEVEALPYEKYFFSGGGNSNRAWRPRRLGPGSYTPPQNEDGSFNYSFEQPGDMIIEFNVEWRYKISQLFQWAFFVDATNVWLLEEDNTRPGGNFDVTRFWKEFGIGAGLGARIDFSFLLIRLDVGTKIYDPARREGDRFVAGYDFLGKGTTEFNIGIGYPF